VAPESAKRLILLDGATSDRLQILAEVSNFGSPHKSRIGEKLAYIHNHWDGLQTFLTDRRVEIDWQSPHL